MPFIVKLGLSGRVRDQLKKRLNYVPEQKRDHCVMPIEDFDDMSHILTKHQYDTLAYYNLKELVKEVTSKQMISLMVRLITKSGDSHRRKFMVAMIQWSNYETIIKLQAKCKDKVDISRYEFREILDDVKILDLTLGAKTYNIDNVVLNIIKVYSNDELLDLTIACMKHPSFKKVLDDEDNYIDFVNDSICMCISTSNTKTLNYIMKLCPNKFVEKMIDMCQKIVLRVILSEKLELSEMIIGNMLTLIDKNRILAIDSYCGRKFGIEFNIPDRCDNDIGKTDALEYMIDLFSKDQIEITDDAIGTMLSYYSVKHDIKCFVIAITHFPVIDRYWKLRIYGSKFRILLKKAEDENGKLEKLIG